MPADVHRVGITEQAEQMLDSLIRRHGAVMFHQSGGCCDGSSPMCCPRGEFRVGASEGSGFSLEAPEGVRFLIRSRLLTDDEVATLESSRRHPSTVM
ncbi:DUF779 domain-containing protein [Nocardia testacea]|uniref:DUF779 domain-containing protein n=1 Tax=Nocardia testacea TaxID=248551 RepID=A0ABW7VYU1_9NOCA